MCVGLIGVCLGCEWVCVCFSLAVPQEMTRWYKSCSYITTFFTKNEAEFLGWNTCVKLGEYCINFGVIVVSDIFIFWTLCEEVQLRLRHSQHAVRAESVLMREPSLSALARLYGQTVFTESVHRQCFPKFHISHGAQVACHGVFSI